MVVNGGRPALEGVALPPPAPSPAGRFCAQPGSGIVGLIERRELKDRLGDLAVFDARTEDEFSGEDLKTNERGGHLPGARLLPHQALMDGGRLLPPDALRRMVL
jgi:thiosulfate/3-mercaptopyruvate sulfurtransferase